MGCRGFRGTFKGDIGVILGCVGFRAQSSQKLRGTFRGDIGVILGRIGFRKIKDTLLRAPLIRTVAFWGP